MFICSFLYRRATTNALIYCSNELIQFILFLTMEAEENLRQLSFFVIRTNCPIFGKIKFLPIFISQGTQSSEITIPQKAWSSMTHSNEIFILRVVKDIFSAYTCQKFDEYDQSNTYSLVTSIKQVLEMIQNFPTLA